MARPAPSLELPQDNCAPVMDYGVPRLGDPWWRLTHLYWITDKSGRVVRFVPNAAQKKLWDNLHTRNIVLKARQMGFSTFILIILLDQVLFNSNTFGGVIAHTKEDAAALFRNKIKYAYDRLPASVLSFLTPLKNDAGELLLSNDSGIRVSTSMRSGTLQLLHVSELGKIAARFPEKANEVITGAIPALTANGLGFIESTAEGMDGAFWNIWSAAWQQKQEGRTFSDLDWFPHFFAWWEDPGYTLDPAGLPIPGRVTDYARKLERDGVVKLTPGQVAWYWKTERTLGSYMKREYPSTPQEAFETAIDGAYYSTQMAGARENRRLTKVPIDPALPVHTAWDLGMDDCTVIWFWQQYGLQVRLVDYYENNGEGLLHYANVLKDKAEAGKYRYGTHLAPHDIEVRELGTGKTRKEMAAEYGIRFTGGPAIGLADGIESVRRFLPMCWFDQERCEAGVRHLDNYRREWNDAMGTWADHPRHDGASHCADAFRILAVGASLAGAGEVYLPAGNPPDPRGWV